MKRRLIKAPGGISHSSLSETPPHKLSCLQSPLQRESLFVLTLGWFMFPPGRPLLEVPDQPLGLHQAQGPNEQGVPGNCHPQKLDHPSNSEAGRGEMRGTRREEGRDGQPRLCDYQSATPLVPRKPCHLQQPVTGLSGGYFSRLLHPVISYQFFTPFLDYLLLPLYR